MSESLQNLFTAVWELLTALGLLVGPWIPLIAWCVFWLFAVNWLKLNRILAKGGWIPVFLIMFAAVLVWGEIAPPASGVHDFGIGWNVSNFYGKLVYVTALVVIMMLCGSVQSSGACDQICRFPEDSDEQAAETAH